MVSRLKAGRTLGVVVTVLTLFVLAPAPSEGVPTIIFTRPATLVDGDIFYGGEGGALLGGEFATEGGGIPLTSIGGVDTPLNAGVALGCVGCFLSFTTGANTSEVFDPITGTRSWLWSGGGSFFVTGGVPFVPPGFLPIPAGSTLLSGSWFTPVNAFLPGLGNQLTIGGGGLDLKHSTLAAIFGLPTPFEFSTVEISTSPTIGGNNSISGIVSAASITNIQQQVPEPASSLLIVLGLVGLSFSFRGRRR